MGSKKVEKQRRPSVQIVLELIDIPRMAAIRTHKWLQVAETRRTFGFTDAAALVAVQYPVGVCVVEHKQIVNAEK